MQKPGDRVRRFRAVIIPVLAALLAESSFGDVFNWIGTTASNSWSDPNNWTDLTTPSPSLTAYPTAADTAILDTSGYNYVNLISPEFFVDTLQLPGSGGSTVFGWPGGGGSLPYTLSSNNGAGSTLLHVNQITANINTSGFGGEGTPNLIDRTVTLQGPDSSPLVISLRHDLNLQGPVIAPGGITAISGETTEDGGILGLYNTSNAISSLNVTGPVYAYGPGSIRNATINFGSFAHFSDVLALVSDLPVADYGNNINSGGAGNVRVQSAVGNYQPFGDPSASIFNLGNVTISSSLFTAFGSTFKVDNGDTHDIIQFQNLNITGPVTLSGSNASPSAPKTVARFSSLTGYIPPPPIVDPCGYTIGIFDPVGPSTLTIDGGEFDFAGGATTPGDITVQNGLLVAQTDASLGTGAIHVNTGGALRFDSPQSTLPTLTVNAGGAIGGNLTGAIYGQNITLADGAILFPTAGPLPARPSTGPIYWRGIDSLTSSFTVGDDGASSIYRGAAFGPFTPDGPFTGTLNEASPGASIQLLATCYTALGDPVSGASATFNSSKDVTITLTDGNYHDEVDLFQPLAGAAHVFNLIGPSGIYNFGPGAFNLMAPGVIPNGDTVNLQRGYLYVATNSGDAVANGAKVNVFAGATLAGGGFTSLSTGTFEIKPGGILTLFYGNITSGATFIFDPDSVIELLSGTDDASWIPTQSDILIDSAISQIGSGLHLSPGRSIGSIRGGELFNTPITSTPDSPDDATFKFNSPVGNLQTPGLYLSTPIDFGPGQTLQIGDTVPTLYTGQIPVGSIQFASNFVNVGTLNVVSGALVLGSSTINASNMTVCRGAILSGTGTLNVEHLTIAGAFAPDLHSGILQVNADTTFRPGATYLWQVVSVTLGSTPGLLFIDGLLTFDPAAASDPILISLQSLDSFGDVNLLPDFDPTQDYLFPLIQATRFAGFDPANFSLDSSQFLNPFTGTWSIEQSTPGELDLAYTAALVPEPCTLLCLTAAAPLFICGRRRVTR